MEENIQYYDTYEENLQREILKMCTSLGMLEGELLASEDIDRKWKEWAPEYIAEALPEVNSYPEFAMACAGYAGMAVAHWWDQCATAMPAYPAWRWHTGGTRTGDAITVPGMSLFTARADSTTWTSIS